MRRLFGGLLMAAGILIAGASGLCSAAILFMDGMSGLSPQNIMTTLPIVLLVGGIPLAIGVGLIIGGRALFRSASEEERPPNF